MKKRVKIPLIVASSVVGAILIAVIILCAITVYPMKSFMDYSAVRVTTSERALPNETLRTDFKSKIDKNLKNTGFSVMHATLEFVGSYGPEFVTEKDEDDKTVRKEMKISEAKEACAATEDSYKFELEFATVKTLTVGKEKVSYDRLVMNVKTTDGELRWVTVYPYLSSMDGTVSPESDEYRVNPVRMRMNTSPLYIALGEIASDSRWGK